MEIEAHIFEPSDLHILIVEDSESYALVLWRVLTKYIGIQDVTVINNIKDAHEAVRRGPGRFNILLIDYHFPTGETGANFITQLYKDKLLEQKIAFIVTSDPTLDTTERAFNAGAAGVIAKPLDSEKLKLQMSQAHRLLYSAGALKSSS